MCIDLATHVEEQFAEGKHIPPSPVSSPPKTFIEILFCVLDKVAASYEPDKLRTASFSNVVNRIQGYGFDSQEQVINLLGVCSYDLYYRVLCIWGMGTPFANEFPCLIRAHYRQVPSSRLGLDEGAIQRLRKGVLGFLGFDAATWPKEPSRGCELQQLCNENGLTPHATEHVTEGLVADLPAARGTDEAAAYGDVADAANGLTADGVAGRKHRLPNRGPRVYLHPHRIFFHGASIYHFKV
ncbi:hypothetical protein VTK26DRAFT_8304 [Humicola hyalothermophila]